MWFDRINAVIDFAILIPFAIDCLALYRARNSQAISLAAQWQYAAYAAWWTIYFAVLGQWFSMGAAVVWVAANLVKIALVVRYRGNRP